MVDEWGTIYQFYRLESVMNRLNLKLMAIFAMIMSFGSTYAYLFNVTLVNKYGADLQYKMVAADQEGKVHTLKKDESTPVNLDKSGFYGSRGLSIKDPNEYFAEKRGFTDLASTAQQLEDMWHAQGITEKGEP